MGGIAGACGRVLDSAPRDMVKRLMRRMERRGPDGGGAYQLAPNPNPTSSTQIVPGARAIVVQRWLQTDHCHCSGGPVISSGGDLVLVLDGAILNIPELRRSLASEDSAIETLSPQEVLVSGFKMKGIEFCKELVGPFALCLLDVPRRTLYLARDAFGTKPLYIHSDTSGLCFSSDITALLEWDHIPRIANPETLYVFLRHGSSRNSVDTFYRDIRQVPGGHYTIVSIDDPGDRQEVAFSQFSLADPIEVPFHEASARVRELFLESVALQIRSTTTVGATLSGGTDSTAIVSCMRELQGSDTAIHTFSYTTPEHPSVNEEPWIDLVNNKLNTIGHKITSQADEFVRSLEPLTIQIGEPLMGTSQYVQRRVFDAAHDAGVKVVLDGVGGDGITAGHAYYMLDRLYGMVRNGDILGALRLSANMLRQPEIRTNRPLRIQAFGYLPTTLQAFIRQYFGQEVFPPWLNEDWFTNRDVVSDIRRVYKGKRPLHEHLLDTCQVDRHARYAERTAATASIQSRLPFYYRPLADYIQSLPADYIVSERGLGRRVFRSAMQGIMPEEIIFRRDKLGYQPPENQWMADYLGWADATMNQGMEQGLPIRRYVVPADIASRRTALSSLVRCVSASIWATSLNVQFK